MALGDGYAAISNSDGHFSSASLVGLGWRIKEDIQRKSGEEDPELEFTLSEELRPRFETCETCAGTTRVETDAIAGQWLRDEFDAIDWSKKATGTCPTCAGLGVEIPGFWQTTSATA